MNIYNPVTVTVTVTATVTVTVTVPQKILQENDLSSVITQTVPLECTHQELSFEWSNLLVLFTRK